MAFLAPAQLELSSDAKVKLLQDLIICPDAGHIASLCWANRIIDKSSDGEIISEKHKLFFWGCHERASVPPAAIWEIKNAELAIQDGRWRNDEKLKLVVSVGVFSIEAI